MRRQSGCDKKFDDLLKNELIENELTIKVWGTDAINNMPAMQKQTKQQQQKGAPYFQSKCCQGFLNLWALHCYLCLINWSWKIATEIH